MPSLLRRLFVLCLAHCLGLDHRNDPSVVELAYNDPQGYTRNFALNGLRVAERVLQGRGDDLEADYGEIFKKDGWEYQERYNEIEGMWYLSTIALLADSYYHSCRTP